MTAVRLTVGRHLVSDRGLARLAAPLAPAGVVIGQDKARQPTAIRLFRPEPTRITLVGGGWAARILAFRVLGAGARVRIVTADPASWHPLAAVGGPGLTVQPPSGEATPTVPTSAPGALTIVDGVWDGGAGTPGPWHTVLTVLPRLTTSNVVAVRGTDLALLQRLTADEVAVARSLWHLDEMTWTLLQEMDDEMFAVVGGSADRYVWASPTEAERRLFGPPTR